MKVFATILTIATLFLSSVPCCQEEGACANSEPVEHCGERHGEKAPSDSESPCSPFYVCGRCPGFTVNYDHIDFFTLDIAQELPPLPYLESLSMEVHSVLFKPPRMI